MASPRDMETPFTLKLQSKNELLVEYVAREGEVHRVIVKIPEN